MNKWVTVLMVVLCLMVATAVVAQSVTYPAEEFAARRAGNSYAG